ncbi:MAG: glycosyltransferase [[Ruminococcus] lactaris]
MKILIIHTMAIDYNGVTDCIVQYLKHMNREGMEATILSTVTVHPDFEKLFQELGCRLERIEIRKEHPLRYMFRLAKLVRREKFDLVHAHGNSATMFF